MTSRVFDLAVIGGGVIGLAHAYVAARAGKRVVVIEKDPRANGASIRNFGFITVTGQARGESWWLARRTRDVWAEIAPKARIRVEHQGLYLTARSVEAIALIEAFLVTEMGEGCARLVPDAFRALSGGLGGPDGVLHIPHELRVESRAAIPALAAWLESGLGVTFLNETVAFEAAPPRLRTSRGVVEAGAVVVCPGDDFVTVYPEPIAGFGLRRCRLSMLKLADPGLRLPGADVGPEPGLLPRLCGPSRGGGADGEAPGRAPGLLRQRRPPDRGPGRRRRFDRRRQPPPRGAAGALRARRSRTRDPRRMRACDWPPAAARARAVDGRLRLGRGPHPSWSMSPSLGCA
jgi:glycine/D-amino acid oxidase-like deaminating enzyme